MRPVGDRFTSFGMILTMRWLPLVEAVVEHARNVLFAHKDDAKYDVGYGMHPPRVFR